MLRPDVFAATGEWCKTGDAKLWEHLEDGPRLQVGKSGSGGKNLAPARTLFSCLLWKVLRDLVALTRPLDFWSRKNGLLLLFLQVSGRSSTDSTGGTS